MSEEKTNPKTEDLTEIRHDDVTDNEAFREASDKFGNIKRYVGDIKTWVIIGLFATSLINLLTNGITIYLYYYAARPMASEAWKDIKATQRRQEYREKNLDLREKKLNKREDTIKTKELLYGFYELYNQ